MSEGGNQDSEKEFNVAAFLLLSTFIVKNLLLLFFFKVFSTKCRPQSKDVAGLNALLISF